MRKPDIKIFWDQPGKLYKDWLIWIKCIILHSVVQSGSNHILFRKYSAEVNFVVIIMVKILDWHVSQIVIYRCSVSADILLTCTLNTKNCLPSALFDMYIYESGTFLVWLIFSWCLTLITTIKFCTSQPGNIPIFKYWLSWIELFDLYQCAPPTQFIVHTPSNSMRSKIHLYYQSCFSSTKFILCCIKGLFPHENY